MIIRITYLVTALVLAPALFARAIQESDPARSQPAKQATQSKQSAQDNLPSPSVTLHFALPPGENAWGLQVLSRGGLTGTGRGDLTVTSEGHFTWSGADGSCSRRLTASSTQPLGSMVLSYNGEPGFNGPKAGDCFDCYVSDLVLQRRETGGEVKTYRLVWDDSTQAKVPSELWKVYEALMALKGCKL